MFDDFENFDPLDFLEFSKELYDKNEIFKSNSSTLKRVMYGRIYYAVFLFVREWLISHSDYESNKDHKNIPKALVNKGPSNKLNNKQISLDFKRLQQLRIQADYFIEVPNENSKEYEKWFTDSVEDAFYRARDIISYF